MKLYPFLASITITLAAAAGCVDDPTLTEQAFALSADEVLYQHACLPHDDLPTAVQAALRPAEYVIVRTPRQRRADGVVVIPFASLSADVQQHHRELATSSCSAADGGLACTAWTDENGGLVAMCSFASITCGIGHGKIWCTA